MDKKQTANFIKQVMGAYPSFEPTPERLEVWQRNLSEMDYDLAIKRLDKHVMTQKFPPSIAEILNPDEHLKRKAKPYDDTLSPAAIMYGGYKEFN